MFTRQGLLLAWKGIRPYFVFSFILFMAGVVIGGTPGAPTDLLEAQMQGVENIAKSIVESENPEWTAFKAITMNNVMISLLVMGLGIIGGIMPFFTLVVNGMVMGYLLSGLAANGENVFMLVVKGILPHGILELSAVFLACAFGMRFGVTLIKGIFGSAFGKTEPWQPFVNTATGAVPALIVVVAFLLLGAVVESTITYWLMSL
ncbi:stage II sporulation protein M [Paenibacillaceae bacterium WGS1546]|uniref:stage II sporulation protein M n=1 Tax=Cohnella sp. WGS1546 TaxID=3366810 RepID=UPI00372D6467